MNIFSQEYSSQLDEEGKRLINIIISNGRIMGKLIDDLLAFSQLGRKALRKREVVMKDMVVEIWNEHSGLEENRKFDFRLLDLIYRVSASAQCTSQLDASTKANGMGRGITRGEKSSQD